MISLIRVPTWVWYFSSSLKARIARRQSISTSNLWIPKFRQSCIPRNIDKKSISRGVFNNRFGLVAVIQYLFYHEEHTPIPAVSASAKTATSTFNFRAPSDSGTHERLSGSAIQLVVEVAWKSWSSIKALCTDSIGCISMSSKIFWFLWYHRPHIIAIILSNADDSEWKPSTLGYYLTKRASQLLYICVAKLKIDWST